MLFNDRGIFGFDVAFYEDNDETPQPIDFNKMKSYGASFVVVKAGQLDYPDPDFITNWRLAREAGLPRSAYWFGDYRATGKSQARKFWELIKNDIGEGLLFIDYERKSWTDWGELYNFLVEFQQLSGLPSSRLGIYTGFYYWTEHSPYIQSSRQWFGQFPLWLAWYGDVADVRVPTPWTECLLWQNGTPPIGLEVGAESREIDYNKFNGDEEKFKFYFGSSPTTPPGDTMTVLYNADLSSGKTSNVRSAPSTSAAIVTVLTGPLTVNIISEKTVAGGYDWYQISSGWIALTSSYANLRPASTTVDDKPVKITVEMESGKIYESTTFNQL